MTALENKDYDMIEKCQKLRAYDEIDSKINHILSKTKHIIDIVKILSNENTNVSKIIDDILDKIKYVGHTLVSTSNEEDRCNEILDDLFTKFDEIDANPEMNTYREKNIDKIDEIVQMGEIFAASTAELTQIIKYNISRCRKLTDLIK
jgi:hypothetical protein